MCFEGHFSLYILVRKLLISSFQLHSVHVAGSAPTGLSCLNIHHTALRWPAREVFLAPGSTWVKILHWFCSKCDRSGARLPPLRMSSPSPTTISDSVKSHERNIQCFFCLPPQSLLSPLCSHGGAGRRRREGFLQGPPRRERHRTGTVEAEGGRGWGSVRNHR